MNRRGFTLAETLVSMAISSLVLGAIGSLFVIMSKALPDDSSSLSRANQLSRAVDRFSFDVSWATQVTMGSPAKCEFVVPDCTGDAIADTVVYEWAGAGRPWKRTLNAGEAETICPAVETLDFLWRYRAVAGTPVTKTLETVQVELTSSNPTAPKVVAKISGMSHAVIP